MFKKFNCKCGIEEQEQELVGMFGANPYYGGFASTTCWSCANVEIYIMPTPENPFNLSAEDLAHKNAFWEKYMQDFQKWKAMPIIERETFKKEIYDSEEQQFKNFRNVMHSSRD